MLVLLNHLRNVLFSIGSCEDILLILLDSIVAIDNLVATFDISIDHWHDFLPLSHS